MYPISAALKALLEAEAKQNAFITVITTTGSAAALTNAEIIQGSMTITRKCVSGSCIEVGNCIAAELEVELLNDSGQLSSVKWSGAELSVAIGVDGSNETMPLGVFIVDGSPKLRDTIKLTALDGMVLFDRNCSGLNSLWDSNPDIADIVNYCCTQCGVTLSSSLLGLPNASYQPPKSPSEELTYRQLLGYCCAVMGCNGYMDWAGNLRIDYYRSIGDTRGIAGIAKAGLAVVGDDGSFIRGTFSSAKRYSYSSEDYRIATTGVEFTAPDGTVYIAGTATYSIDLTGNPLIQDNEATILTNLNGLIGIKYHPLVASTVPCPYIWPMDWVDFGDGIIAPVMELAFRLNGNCAMSSIGDSEETKLATNANNLCKIIHASGVFATEIHASNLHVEGGSIHLNSSVESSDLIQLNKGLQSTRMSPYAFRVYNTFGNQTVLLANRTSYGNGGALWLSNADGAAKAWLIATESGGGELNLNSPDDVNAVLLSAYQGYGELRLKNASNTATIRLTANDGNITCVSLTQTSKVDNKADIEVLDAETAKAILETTEIYKYFLNIERENGIDKKHYGAVIGAGYSASEEILSPSKDGADIYSMVSVLWKVVKDQANRIKDLEQKLEDLLYGAR